MFYGAKHCTEKKFDPIRIFATWDIGLFHFSENWRQKAFMTALFCQEFWIKNLFEREGEFGVLEELKKRHSLDDLN
jgi:hypothetical protein